MTDYRFKTTPLRHQLEEHERWRDVPGRALWWEPGTGKTKSCVDLACYLWCTGRVGACVALSPGTSLKSSWARVEIPAHCSVEDAVVFEWSTARASTQKFRREAEEFYSSRWRLRFLSMSYDSLMTKAGASFLRRLMDSCRCLVVFDESSAIKTPGAKVTMRARAVAAAAPWRRVLNGTPVSDSPMHAYSQVAAADRSVWERRGIRNFLDFKVRYGIWKNIAPRSGGREFPMLVSYRNLDDLREALSEVGTRVVKSEVLDLPPKVYHRHYFSLLPSQRKAYDQLDREFRTVLEGGGVVTAEVQLVRYVRLQQIASGYVPVDDTRLVERLVPKEDNPRPAALVDAFREHVQSKAVVWAKYDQEVDDVLDALREAGIEAVRLDGRDQEDDRQAALSRFLGGGAVALVSKVTVAGRGLTLNVADAELYYSNTFSLLGRKQSEDRAHRIGQTRQLKIVDLVAEDTVDEVIADALAKKQEIEEALLDFGDRGK